MIDELEFWGVDSSSGNANADAMRAAEESEPRELPPVDGRCSDCRKPLAQFTTIHVHLGKPYCPSCYNAEAGS